MKYRGLIFVYLLLCTALLYGNTTLIPFGSTWKYLDNGTDQGTAWQGIGFNDAVWATGNGQLGYGDGDEATTVSAGCTPVATCGPKYITTYFRKVINIADVSIYGGYTLNVRRDDGVIVYINGVEVFRNNMAAGAVNYLTLATSAADDGNTPQSINLPASVCANGNNTIAVEIHQTNNTSSDITMDLEFIGLSTSTLLNFGSSWKYLDNGSDQGTAWTTTLFNDASWLLGNGQLGYGDGDEATLLSAGCTPVATCGPKYITTYFRRQISIADVSQYSSVKFNCLRDDGVVLYVNGVEVARNNMPAGTINYLTLASANAADDGNTVQVINVPITSFVNGTNTIAVEVHQVNNTSSDITFDLELVGVSSSVLPVLTRGPYLQKGTSSSLILRWRTDLPTDSKVSYGLTAGNLNMVVTNATVATEHEVAITGLTANTKYFYNIGSSSNVLQGDALNYFVTAVTPGTNQVTNIWAMGDCGNNSTNQANVRDRYLSYMGTRHADLWLLLGDNAYNSGFDNEYQTNFFNIYKDDILKNTMLFPAPGNHDYANNGTRQNDHAIPYYDIFNLPSNGECGGVPSNTEAFYSFDYNNIHFLSLDSYGREANTYRIWDTLGPQVVWVKNDLAANTKPWVIAYWHHPPYTMGSHNSDSESDLAAIRTNFIRILERMGVDLILCGHSHCYERSYLLNGHYGNEPTFNLATQAVSNSSAKYDGSLNSCPYEKSTDHPIGTVYTVVGSAGQLGGTQSAFPHNAMLYSNATNGGSLFLQIDDNRLDAKWICADGVIRDQFTMFNDIRKTNTVFISPGNSVTLTASWPGDYSWTHDGSTTRSITVAPVTNTTYEVKDVNNCVIDVFNVVVNVLPVELIYFNGYDKKDVVLLDWETGSEVNVDRFIIEKSGNGVDFFELGSKDAKGTSSINTYYSIEDAFPYSGVNYYRIKILDNDGSYSYSKIIQVKHLVQGTASIMVYPNPVLSECNVYCRNFTAFEQVQMQISNIQGQVLTDFAFYFNPSEYVVPIDMTNFSDGIYLLKVKTQSAEIVKKIVCSH
ncbi:MAG: metallophosphoesterase [Chitinophagales bacterium]|nr:metallophosphoesterase [Chitinophagales bacterium]